MLRVVLDTNIYISAIHFGDLPVKIIKLALKEKIRIYISREITTEIIGVLKKKSLYEKEILEEVEYLLYQTCQTVEPLKTIKKIKNKPSDNRILECGAEAKAQYIVSGDKKHLLSLKEHRGVKIISASEFLNIFKNLAD